MPKPYIVRKGDTLPKIAEALFGDRKLAAALAGYNGLPDAKSIVVGQAIHIPAKSELAPPKKKGPAGARAGVMPWPNAPHGLAEIQATFGDLTQFPPGPNNEANAKWEAQFLASAKLPQPIPLTFNLAVSARSLRCHKLLVPLYEAVFADIMAKGLWGSIKTTGGGYNWRMKRGQAKPSTHTWGIAFDLNDKTNAMGTAGDMDPRLVELIEGYGFTWGGRWSGQNKDPMHFQYCSGY